MIETLAPFGEGNELPVFSMKGLRVLAAQTVGQDGKHLRLRLRGGNNVFLAVGFGMGEMCQKISDGMMVDVAFTMNINTYQGNENLQLMLKDIKF